MKKQMYQKPTMNVVKIQHSQMLCGSITGVKGGDIGYGGGSSGPARGRESSGWFDDEDE